ncbi:LOW QUALITY PROTEIN: WD repeat-containing protein 74 [Eudromia elegans]
MAPPTRRMHVWVGAETGALKGVDLRRKQATNFLSGGGLSRARGVCALCWGDDGETEVLVGGADRAVRVFSPERGAFTGTRLCPGGGGAFCGLGRHRGALITCVESGLVKVWREDESENVELQAGAGLCRMRQHPERPQLVATGGRENPLKLWDLQRPREPLFRAKNVRNDWLDLRVPVWDRDLQFVPGSDRVVTCTGHHQVRLYDPGSPQRRPVLEVTLGEHPLTALALAPGATSVVVGSARGDLAVVDLRQGRVLRRLRGAAGAVRGLQCHPRRPLVASCGLDRRLRLHALRGGRGHGASSVYLKSRLNCLLLSGHQDWEVDADEDEDAEGEGPAEGEGEADALWAAMEPAAPPAPRRPPKRKAT